MVMVAGSKALALIITDTVGPVGTIVVIRVAGEVSFKLSFGLDGTDIHPQINAPAINAMSRIAEFFMKERMDVYLIILFP
jgi:hypothetical protein